MLQIRTTLSDLDVKLKPRLIGMVVVAQNDSRAKAFYKQYFVMIEMLFLKWIFSNHSIQFLNMKIKYMKC